MHASDDHDHNCYNNNKLYHFHDDFNNNHNDFNNNNHKHLGLLLDLFPEACSSSLGNEVEWRSPATSVFHCTWSTQSFRYR